MNISLNVFSKFRNGRRNAYSYKCLIRVIRNQLDAIARTSGATGDEVEDVIEDLENLAMSRAIKKHRYFLNLDDWTRVTKGYKTKIRYDILEEFKKITKDNPDSMNFLMSMELATLCSECHLDSQNGDIKDFWNKIESEINELAEKTIA